MQEEIDKAFAQIKKLSDIWENEEHTEQVAKDLQFALTVVKFIIKADEFDQLPAFSRYLKETTEFLAPKKGGQE